MSKRSDLGPRTRAGPAIDPADGFVFNSDYEALGALDLALSGTPT
jgi:hypothetical protein